MEPHRTSQYCKLVVGRTDAADILGKPYLNSGSSLRTIDWANKFHLLDDYTTTTTSSTSRVLKDDPFTTEKVILVENLLSVAECEEIILKCGEQHLQQMKKHYKVGRTNSRLVIFDEDFATFLWKKLQPIVLEIYGNVNARPLGFDVLRGKWEFSGINEAMRFNVYQSCSKDSFKPHRDSQFCPSGDERSLLSLVLYLNDGFQGGQTKFYFPKNVVDSKGVSMNDEIERNGGLAEGYDVLTVQPKCGTAVLFSQNIIHESTPMVHWRSLLKPKSRKRARKPTDIVENKFIIRTDIMMTRKEETFGFDICEAEKLDYLSCLNLFRQAQQLELSSEETSDAGEYYEKCLSIRYSYPTPEMLKSYQSDEEHPVSVSSNSSQNVEETIHSLSEMESPDVGTRLSKEAYMLFSAEIWQKILQYLPLENDLQNIVAAYPELHWVKKLFDGDKMIPTVKYNKGIFSAFEFPDEEYFSCNVENCCRLAALYAVFLLGHDKKSKTYIVDYNRDSNQVVAVNLKDFLKCVFYEEACYGALFKVQQQDPDRVNVEKDFISSVDRGMMYQNFGKQFFGKDFEHEKCCEIEKTDSKQTFECYDETLHLNNIKEYCVDNIGDPSHINCFDRLYDMIDTNSRASMMEVQQWHNEFEKEGGNSSKDDDDECSLYSLGGNYEEYDEETAERHLDHLDGLLDKGKKFEHLSGSSFVGGSLLRQSTEKHEFRSGMGICCCMFSPTQLSYPPLKKHLQSKTFNHLIADFSCQRFNVRETATKLSGRKTKDFCCFGGDYLLGKIREERQLDDHMVRSFVVDISEFCDDGPHNGGFNHASCQCIAPSFNLIDYVNIRSYPYMNHVHIAVVQDEAKSNVWVSYGGIAAL